MKKFLIKGDYNYRLLTVNCRSNCYLVNYNLYLKRNLGKKHKLDWISFIKFIKEEFVGLKNLVIENTEIIYVRELRKITFNIEKFTETNYKENIKKKNNNNFYKTNFNWLIYEHNPCRYDVLFLCIFLFMNLD